MPNEPHPSSPVELKTKRSRFGRLMGVQILGVGSYAPPNVVRNADLASLGCDEDWIVQRTGILERRHCPPEMATSDMAVEASRRCIDACGANGDDIDLVLLGTYTPDYLMPSTAGLVQARLGLSAPAMDLQAACASFVFAMLSGMQFVATGCSRLSLVIGADTNSRVVNRSDPKTFPLFGDAAGAILVAPGSPEQGVLAYAAGNDGAGAEMLYRPMGGTRYPFDDGAPPDGRHYVAMEGRAVFKWAIRMLQETTNEVLAAAGMTLEEVDIAIFHQANVRIINSAVADLGLAPEKVFNNLDRFGNTSSASIPLALDQALQQGRIRRGSHVLFSGFGGGLAWGTVLLRW